MNQTELLMQLMEVTSRQHCCTIQNVLGVKRTGLQRRLKLQRCFANLSLMVLVFLLYYLNLILVMASKLGIELRHR